MSEHEKRRERLDPTGGGGNGGDPSGLDAWRAEGMRLWSAADDAIQRALSGDSQAFLRSSQQEPGQ